MLSYFLLSTVEMLFYTSCHCWLRQQQAFKDMRSSLKLATRLRVHPLPSTIPIIGK